MRTAVPKNRRPVPLGETCGVESTPDSLGWGPIGPGGGLPPGTLRDARGGVGRRENSSDDDLRMVRDRMSHARDAGASTRPVASGVGPDLAGPGRPRAVRLPVGRLRPVREAQAKDGASPRAGLPRPGLGGLLWRGGGDHRRPRSSTGRRPSGRRPWWSPPPIRAGSCRHPTTRCRKSSSRPRRRRDPARPPTPPLRRGRDPRRARPITRRSGPATAPVGLAARTWRGH